MYPRNVKEAIIGLLCGIAGGVVAFFTPVVWQCDSKRLSKIRIQFHGGFSFRGWIQSILTMHEEPKEVA